MLFLGWSWGVNVHCWLLDSILPSLKLKSWFPQLALCQLSWHVRVMLWLQLPAFQWHLLIKLFHLCWFLKDRLLQKQKRNYFICGYARAIALLYFGISIVSLHIESSINLKFFTSNNSNWRHHGITVCGERKICNSVMICFICQLDTVKSLLKGWLRPGCGGVYRELSWLDWCGKTHPTVGGTIGWVESWSVLSKSGERKLSTKHACILSLCCCLWMWLATSVPALTSWLLEGL